MLITTRNSMKLFIEGKEEYIYVKFKFRMAKPTLIIYELTTISSSKSAKLTKINLKLKEVKTECVS